MDWNYRIVRRCRPLVHCGSTYLTVAPVKYDNGFPVCITIEPPVYGASEAEMIEGMRENLRARLLAFGRPTLDERYDFDVKPEPRPRLQARDAQGRQDDGGEGYQPKVVRFRSHRARQKSRA